MPNVNIVFYILGS